jgi:rSAM/selenodomain-associated transferase 2
MLLMSLPAPHRIRPGHGLAAAALSAALLALLVRLIEWHKLAAVAQTIQWSWWLLAQGLFGVTGLCKGIQWHRRLRQNGVATHHGATLRCSLLGYCLANVFGGLPDGEAAKAGFYANWFKAPMPAVLAAGVMSRILEIAGGLLLVGSGVFLVPAVVSTGSLRGEALAPVGVIFTGALIWQIGRIRANWTVLRAGHGVVRGNLRRLPAHPRELVVELMLVLTAHLAFGGAFVLCVLAVVAEPLPVLRLIWVSWMVQLAASLPRTFAGLGAREWAGLVLLVPCGLEPAEAAAAAGLMSALHLAWAAWGAAIWSRESRDQRRHAATPDARSISVVIPTFNEAAALPETLAHLRNIPEVDEIIVADGGSGDGTRELASALGCRVLTSARGRGMQLRQGGAATRGDVVLMVHADTWLPPDAGGALLHCLRDRTVVAGGFWKRFREPHPLLRGSRWRCALRLYLARRVLGDQAIFVRRAILEKIGGVPPLPLMEEFELCRRLRREGRLALAPAVVSTSARRFARRGVWRTYARMWRVTLLYHLGATPEKLRRIYEQP